MTRNPSNQRPPFRRPTILIGTDSTMLGRPMIGPSQASAAGLHGIDLDLRRAWRSPGPGSLADDTSIRVRSVWLPALYTGPFAAQRAERLASFLEHATAHLGLRTLILPKPGSSRAHGVPLGPVAGDIATRMGARIALRLGAETLLERSGSHLEHVANMRRIAEEWDMDIALDLTSPDIERWEAEAALVRLFPRLTLVRIRPAHDGDGLPGTTSEARASLRTIGMLADQGYSGTITIAPEPVAPSWMSFLYVPNLEIANITRESIMGAYDRIDLYDETTRESRQHHP